MSLQSYILVIPSLYLLYHEHTCYTSTSLFMISCNCKPQHRDRRHTVQRHTENEYTDPIKKPKNDYKYTGSASQKTTLTTNDKGRRNSANDKGVAKRARSSTYLYLEIDMHSVFPWALWERISNKILNHSLWINIFISFLTNVYF